MTRLRILLSSLGLLALLPAAAAARERQSLDDDLRHYAAQARARAEDLKAQRERYAAYAATPGDPFAEKYAALTRQIEAAEKSAAKYGEFIGVDTGAMAVLKETARRSADDLAEMNRLLLDNWALWLEDALSGNWTNLVKTGYDTMFRQKVRQQIREALGVAETVAPLEAYLMDLALGVETKDNATIATEWFRQQTGLAPADLKKTPREIAELAALRRLNLDPATIERLAELSVSPANIDIDWAGVRETAFAQATSKGLEKLKTKYAAEAKRQFQARMKQELGALSHATDSLAEQVRDSALAKAGDAIDAAQFATDIAQKIYQWSQADFGPVFDGVKQYRALLQKATGQPATWEEAFVAWQARSKFGGTKKPAPGPQPVVENTQPLLLNTRVVDGALDRGRVALRLETTWRALAPDPRGFGGFVKLTRDGVTLAERLPQASTKSAKTVAHPHTLLNDPATGKPARTEHEVVIVHTFTDTLVDHQREPVPLRHWDYEFIWERINDQGATERLGQARFTPRFAISLVAGRSGQTIALHERELTEAERRVAAATAAPALQAGPVPPIPWVPPANTIVVRSGKTENLFLRDAQGRDTPIGTRLHDAAGNLSYQKIEIAGRIQGLHLTEGGRMGYQWYHDGVPHGPFEQGRTKGSYRHGRLHGPWEQRQGPDLVLHETRTYVDGQPDGESTTFHPDGATPRRVLLFARGTLLPPQRFYAANGQLQAEYCFDSHVPATAVAETVELPFETPQTGSLDGTVRKFRDDVLVESIDYRAGVRHGRHVVGQPESRRETTYRDGVRHGLVREYQRGLLAKEEEYAEGRLTVRRVFREHNGESRLQTEDRYRDDRRHGTCRGFDLASGAVGYEHEYVDGEKIRARDGTTFTEFKDGQPTLGTTYYALGGPKRLVKRFHPDGSWDETRHYESGAVEEESLRGNVTIRGGTTEACIGRCVRYYADGTKKLEATYGPDGKFAGLVVNYGPGGIKKEETEYRDRVKVGLARTFHANGKVRSEARYTEGRRHGPEREYFEDGSLRREEHYRDDRRHGIQRRYAAPGVLAEETEFADGKKHGVHRRHRIDGSLELECTYRNDQHEGAYKRWYASGRLWWDFNYVAGRKHGRCVEYREEGTIQWSDSGLFEDGTRLAPLPEQAEQSGPPATARSGGDLRDND